MLQGGIGDLTRILVIDDEKGILDLMRRALEREGYIVTVQDDPMKLDYSSLPKYQMILLDVMMPESTALPCAAKSGIWWTARFCL